MAATNTTPKAAISAKDVFVQALRFDFSTGVLFHFATRRKAEIRESAESEPPTAVAGMACEAFAIELYLKTILCLESLTIPHSHALDTLFNATPQAWQDRIAVAYEAELKMPYFQSILSSPAWTADIRASLAQLSKAFEKWRYLFEGEPATHFLSPARFAIQKSIIQVNPEWEKLRKDLNKPFPPQAQLTTEQLDEFLRCRMAGNLK